MREKKSRRSDLEEGSLQRFRPIFDIYFQNRFVVQQLYAFKTIWIEILACSQIRVEIAVPPCKPRSIADIILLCKIRPGNRGGGT